MADLCACRVTHPGWWRREKKRDYIYKVSLDSVPLMQFLEHYRILEVSLISCHQI